MKNTQLPLNTRKCFIQFMYYYANNTLPFVVGHDILGGDVDYLEEMTEIPTNFETMVAIYVNNILINKKGEVSNHKHAMTRAAQFIRTVYDPKYNVEPKFEDWELKKC